MNVKLSLDSIETAHRFVVLLCEAVVESKREIEGDVKREDGGFPRRHDAMRLVLSKLERLDFLLTRSRRMLNDLRSLRRLMFEERGAARVTPAISPVATLPAFKAEAPVAAAKRRALSARLEATPRQDGRPQIMPWYLRPDARAGVGLKRAA